MWSCWSVVMLALVLADARAASSVTVLKLQLIYEQTYELPLNSSVEYILDVAAQGVPAEEASVVWAHSDGGDHANPVLITARHRAGAETWQLPYAVGERDLYELERALCPLDGASGVAAAASACDGEEDGAGRRGVLSLHVSTTCAARLTLRVRLSRPPLWRLPFHRPVVLLANLSSPRVAYYRFAEAQSRVRLTASSGSDVCALFAVQNYSCPIAQTEAGLFMSSLRMTMMRSGAVQLSRSEYPRGFLVVALVLPSQELCAGQWEGEGGAVESKEAYLWEEALLGPPDHHTTRVLNRKKEFIITVEPALTRGQYVAAGGTLLAVFLGFYLLFGALVLAQRWPPLAPYVLPKAVLATAAEEARASRLDESTERQRAARRRRDSGATFDSSDNSDSEDDEQTLRGANYSLPPAPTRIAPVLAPVSTVPVPPDPSLLVAVSVAPVAPAPVSPAASPSTPASNGAPTDGQETSVHTADQTTQQMAQADPNNMQMQGPFGLPAQLRLAALARRRGRTLRARSDRYLHMLYTVAVFYALPVVQFVLAFQVILNVSGSLDICYYNFLCAHRAGALSDFNHVLSNLGYLLLGALFMLQVRRRRLRRKRQPRHSEYGIPAHYGLLSALGAGMMVVAVLSASYHICPNRLNFQFDTAFMYVLAVLMMVKIYQSRHPDVNARAHATFGVLAVLIALVVWGVLGGGTVFWAVFTVLHVFTFLLLSLRIYYVGQFRLEKQSLAEAASSMRAGAVHYRARLVLLVLGNVLNWLLAGYGLLAHSGDFAGHMLQVLLGNALAYVAFYLGMKLAHGERPRAYCWALLAAAAAAWTAALYFFVSGPTDWSATPALSRHRNDRCLVMEFYDAHDLWHALSAVALYLTFNVLLTWDDGLSAVKRTDIPVF